MPFDRFYCSIVPVPAGICADAVLERVLGGDDKVYPVEFLFPGQVFHDGLMADVQRVERP